MDTKVLGERIRQARERLSMTQEVLAELTHKDQRAISEYENGKRRLSAVDVPAFAKALEVSILYFYETEAGDDDFQAAMLQVFNRLHTPETKQTAIEFIRLYVDSIHLISSQA